MAPNTSRLLTAGAMAALLAALLAACGGGGGGGTMSVTPPTSTTGTVSMLVSDASTEDWSMIGVKILSIALVPQGGGANVTVYTAPTPVPCTNLVELDQIADLLGSATVPTGTYTGAVLTLSANPGDVMLTVAADPEAGFAAAAGSSIPTAQVQIQHAEGTSPNLTVPVSVNFVSPLVVAMNQNNALDLEFDLGHPAFLIGHVPPSAGMTLWAVNFNGPVRHHPLYDLNRLVLRHMYGDVASISSDNTSIKITKEFPTEPPVNPETEITSTQSVVILADATNGTIFYDMDAKTRTVIKDFSTETSLPGMQVRVAARYQEDGTLVATRIWASSSFNTVWLSPEGHVLHVNDTSGVVTVEDERGRGVPLTVNADTQFFFREPQNPAVDSAPIGTGLTFLTNHNLVRGFKVHATAVDVLASPLVAQSIDIETAAYSGKVSAPDDSGFTLTRLFRTAADDYVYTLDYINGGTPNGTDDTGMAIDGFKFWNFAYPTILTSGTNVIPDFIAATDGSVNFGGVVGSVASRSVAFGLWTGPADTGSWNAAVDILTPSLLPLGFVADGLSMSNAFTMTVLGGTDSATVDVNVTAGSATLVYQVDRTGNVVTISPIDITSSSGYATFKSALTSGVPVKVYGVPQANDVLNAYVLAYFTGVMPAQ
jgi:Domain of unknown function (DUF4382)/Domain of unknown function (DUF5666)